jgi:hypothetical protein
MTIRLALRVHITDVLFPGIGREVELEADAVTFQDIALAVGDAVVDEAAGGGAERVSLILAYHEGGFGIEERIFVEGDGRYCGEQLERLPWRTWLRRTDLRRASGCHPSARKHSEVT